MNKVFIHPLVLASSRKAGELSLSANAAQKKWNLVMCQADMRDKREMLVFFVVEEMYRIEKVERL